MGLKTVAIEKGQKVMSWYKDNFLVANVALILLHAVYMWWMHQPCDKDGKKFSYTFNAAFQAAAVGALLVMLIAFPAYLDIQFIKDKTEEFAAAGRPAIIPSVQAGGAMLPFI